MRISRFLTGSVRKRMIAARRTRHRRDQLTSIHRRVSRLFSEYEDFVRGWRRDSYPKARVSALIRREEIRDILKRAEAFA